MPDEGGAFDAARLPDDVLAALGTLGGVPVAASQVGGWRAGRATYRVALADGRVVKARRLQSGRKSARAAELVSALHDPAVPPPLIVAGRVTIEAWVEGVPLSELRLDAAHIDAAADLLGRLHTDPDRTRPRGGGHRSPRVLMAQLERQLDDLYQAGVVRRVEQRRLARVLRDGVPERAAWGLTHGDLCAANLVLTPDGDVVSVDNERLRFNFLDLDVARTWCRWPMAARSWSRFLRRYASAGRRFEPATAMSWYAAAAVRRAHRWQRTRRTDPEAVGALRRVLDGSA